MTDKKNLRPWIVTGSVLALLAVLVLFLLPLGIQYSLSKWLLSKGADTAVINRVRFNPFLGTMSLEGVTVKIGDRTVLSDSDIQLDINMLALLKKEAILEKSTLAGVTLDIERYEDGRMRIGSYTTTTGTEEEESASKTPWFFAANQIEMANCTIRFRMVDLDLTLHVDTARLIKFTTAPGDKSGSFYLAGTINGTPLVIDLETLRILPDLVCLGKIKVERFALDNLADLLGPTLDPFSGAASIDGKVQFRMTDLGDIFVDYDGMLEVDNGNIGGTSYHVKGAPVRWQQGTIHFAMTEKEGIDIDVNGRLTGNKVEVILPDPTLHVQGPEVDINGQVKVTVAEQVRVDARAGLVLNNPSLAMDNLKIKAEKLAWQDEKPHIRFQSASAGTPLSVTAQGSFLAGRYTLSSLPQGSENEPVSTSGRELVYNGSATYEGSGGTGSSSHVQTNGSLSGKEITLALPQLLDLRQQAIQHVGKVNVTLKGKKGLTLTLDDKLRGDDLLIDLKDTDLAIGQQRFVTTHKGTINLDDRISVRGTASAEANGFTIKKPKENKTIASLDKVAIKAAKAPTENHISVDTVQATNLVYHLAGTLPMTIALPAITMHAIQSKNLADWSVAKVTAQQPVAISERSRDRLAGLGSLEIRSISVDKELHVGVDRILFDDLFFLKPGQKAGRSICTIGGARLSKLGWQPDKGLHAISLSFADLYCTILRNKDGALLLSKQLDAMRDPNAAKKEAATTEKSSEKNMPIRLDQVTLRGKSGLHFEDHTLAIPFISNLAITTFQITKLDSAHPGQPARLRLKGTLEKRAPLSVTGSISPFADPSAMHLNLLLKNYPLKHLSAYTVQSVGVALASGSLRIDSDINLAANKLDMKNKVLLKQLKTSTISKDLAAKLDNQLPIPLDSALSILRDRDDTIKLDVPISGPLDKLNVGIADILITALGKAIVPAASGYLVYALGPYGALAWVGMELGSRMLAVKLPPVLFEPGRTALPDNIDDYFSRLAKILQDKPKADLRLCPKTSAWELMEEEKKEGKEPPELSAEMKKQLQELGQKRAAAIKKHLVEKFGVDKSRLLVCTTEIETKKSTKPRVEIRM